MGSLKFVFGPTCKTGYKPPRHCLEIHKDGIFVCGGRQAFFFLPHENEWYQLEDMILEHQNHSAVQYNDKVFIFDDQRLSPGNSPVAEYYMSSANSWAAMQTKFRYKERISSLVVLSNDLYTLAVDEESYEDTLYVYDPKTNNWLVKTLKPSGCWGACGVTDGKHLYIIGGTNCGDPLIDGTSKVMRCDPSADSWEEIAPMNEARHDAFGTAMNGKIYVAGGLLRSDQSLEVLGTCEVYNPSTDEWHVMPSLNVCRHSASMVCFRDGLYVVGGLKDKHKSKRELSVEVFDSEANEWKEKATIPVNHERKTGIKKTILNHFKACFATVHKDALESPALLAKILV